MPTIPQTVTIDLAELRELTEKIRATICYESVLLDFAMRNSKDLYTTEPLVISAKGFNDRLFDLYKDLAELVEDSAQKGEGHGDQNRSE